MPKLSKKEQIIQINLAIKTAEERIEDLIEHPNRISSDNVECKICVRAAEIQPEKSFFANCSYCILGKFGCSKKGNWFAKFADACDDLNSDLALKILKNRLKYWQGRLEKLKK